VKSVDPQLNEAQATLVLNAPMGKGTVSTHACSGGAPTAGGSAGANASITVEEGYHLTSSSLPTGTVVSFPFEYSIASRQMASVTDQQDFSGGDAEVQARVTLTTGSGSPYLDLAGTTTSFSGIDQASKTGDLDPAMDGKKVPITAKVGDFFQLILFLKASDGSQSSGIPGVDCDSQSALLWDFGIGPDLQLVNIDNPLEMAATDGGADPSDALAAVPPRPDDLVPEPTGGVLLCLSGVVAGLRGRRRRQ
jgi:hypothetical protein